MFFKELFDFKKCKYDMLNSIIEKKVFLNSEDINIFIDLDEWIDTIIKNEEDENSSKLVVGRGFFASAIVNMISYLRDFFFRHNCRTFFFLYADFKEATIKSSSPDFLEYLKNELNISFMLGQNAIPGVYFMSSKDFDKCIIPYSIDNTSGDNNRNIIVSSRQKSYSFLSILKHSTFILNLQGRFSEITTNSDIAHKVIEYGNFASYLSIFGDKKYAQGIKKGLRQSTVKKWLEKYNFVNIIPSLSEIEDMISINSGEDSLLIFKENYINFDIISIIKHGSSIITDNAVSRQIIDLRNDDEFEDINREFFSTCPIDRYKLMEGF